MKSSLSILVAASTVALLSACGGDGGNSSPFGTSVSISSSNQTTVARASLNGGLAISLAQGAVGTGTSLAPDAAGRAHAQGIVQRALASVRSRRAIASADVHPSAANTVTDNCAAGGTVASTFDDKDGNQQLSTGDVISAVFTQCRQSATDVIDGSVVVTVTAQPTQTQFAATGQFQNLSVDDGVSKSTISGSISIAETNSDVRSDDAIQVGSDGLHVSVASTTYTDAIAFQSGLQINTTDVGNLSSVAVAGTMTATSLGGSVTLGTPVPLTQSTGDTYPSSGQVLVTGGSGSKLLITVLNNAQVKLELDSNGDGTIDSTTTVAWSTLVF
jgi:hypothetical protein